MRCPEHARGEERPRASGGATRRGNALLGNAYDDEGHSRTVTGQPVHASPLGRAHIEPVNPGEIGCDRPERASASERAGFVTLRRFVKFGPLFLDCLALKKQCLLSLS